jgi:DNA-binding ferritin-like protein
MNFVTNLLTLHNQMRVYHWQTQKKPGSYAQHMAFGTAYQDLDPLIDDFIEIYQGKKGAIMAKGNFTVVLRNLADDHVEFIDEFIQYLQDHVSSALDAEKDTDLLNLRDEIMGVLNQTKYRLNMS